MGKYLSWLVTIPGTDQKVFATGTWQEWKWSAKSCSPPLGRNFYCYLKSTPSGQPNIQTPLQGVTSGYSLKPCGPHPGGHFGSFHHYKRCQLVSHWLLPVSHLSIRQCLVCLRFIPTSTSREPTTDSSSRRTMRNARGPAQMTPFVSSSHLQMTTFHWRRSGKYLPLTAGHIFLLIFSARMVLPNCFSLALLVLWAGYPHPIIHLHLTLQCAAFFSHRPMANVLSAFI